MPHKKTPTPQHTNGSSRIRLLSILADPTRLRLLFILNGNELSVAEMQECLKVGQSRISTHLSQLKSVALVQDRREGQRAYYRLVEGMEKDPLIQAAFQAVEELPMTQSDREALDHVLNKRREQTEKHFNAIAGRLGRNYCPGRSWEAIGHLFLEMVSSGVVADLGAGEGVLSQMLARRAEKVIAIDISPKMVEVGTEMAKKGGVSNLEFRCGDMAAPPIQKKSVDRVILSQALHHAVQPEQVLQASWEILKPGGQILILDLNQHTFEEARELYADVWLGFSEVELERMLKKAGFTGIHITTVAKESVAPHFQTILGVGVRK